MATQNEGLFPSRAQESGNSKDSCPPCADSATGLLHLVVLLSQHMASMLAAVEEKSQGGTSSPQSSTVWHFYSQLTRQNWSRDSTQLQVGWQMWESLWLFGEQQCLYSLGNKEPEVRNGSSVGRPDGVHIVTWSITRAKRGRDLQGPDRGG